MWRIWFYSTLKDKHDNYLGHYYIQSDHRILYSGPSGIISVVNYVPSRCMPIYWLHINTHESIPASGVWYFQILSLHLVLAMIEGWYLVAMIF